MKEELRTILNQTQEEIPPRVLKLLIDAIPRRFKSQETPEAIVGTAMEPLKEEEILQALMAYRSNWKISARWHPDAEWIALPDSPDGKINKITIVDPNQEPTDEEQPTYTYEEATKRIEAYLLKAPNTEIMLHNTHSMRLVKPTPAPNEV